MVKILMKRSLYIFVLFALVFTLQPPLKANAQEATPPENNAGAVICAPDVYLAPPSDCLALGPSEYLTQMAQLGITVPLKPLAGIVPAYSLSSLPYLYYHLNGTGTNIYSSMEAAIAQDGAIRSVGPGHFLYVTYIQRVDTPRNGTYFLLPSGEWMPGDGSTASVGPIFQGLEFPATPKNGFGWVLGDAEVRSEPGFLDSKKTGQILHRFDTVQIFSAQTVDDNEWFLIGAGEWVESRLVGAVFPNPTPPDGVTNGRWIDVNLEEQTLAVYDNQKMVFATLVATGVEPFWTRPGLFQIYQKKETENMSGSFEADHSDYYYLEDVPWTMYFDKARALHGAYWSPLLGYQQSHGCVNMSVGDSHWLYLWAKEGDWVYVHDPSGVTPTDPAKYGEGGA
jgi:hypothetical protein